MLDLHVNRYQGPEAMEKRGFDVSEGAVDTTPPRAAHCNILTLDLESDSELADSKTTTSISLAR